MKKRQVGYVLSYTLNYVEHQLLLTEVLNTIHVAHYRCRTGEHLGTGVKFDKFEAVSLVPHFISSRQDTQHVKS